MKVTFAPQTLRSGLKQILFVDEALITSEVQRPMVVEPDLERWRDVGLTEPAPDGISPVRILTGADRTRVLDEFVESLLRLLP